MSRALPRSVSISTGTIFRAALLVLGLVMLWEIRDILLTLFTALLLAGVMYPFAHLANQYKIPKGLAVILFYIVMFGVFGLAFSLLIPALLDEVKLLSISYGSSWSWVRDALAYLNQIRDAGDVSTWIRPEQLAGWSSQIRATVGGLVSTSFDVFRAVFGSIAGLIIVLVLALYIIVEESAVQRFFQMIVPRHYYPFASHVVWEIIQKLGAWMRGQLILALVIGGLLFIGYTIIGVPYALLLALCAGLLEFIPYIGPFLAAVPALFFAVSVSPWHAGMTLVLIIVVQQLENHFIVPKVMQKAVGLNPIVSVIAFLIGAKLFGVVGALFSIPVAAAIVVGVTEYERWKGHEEI